MTLHLPADIDVTSCAPYPVSARREHRPVTGGGPISRVTRMGTRWAMAIQIAPYAYADALDLTDLEDDEERISVPIPQPGLEIGDPGNPVIDGAGQSGNQYALRGMVPGYTIRKGQWAPVLVGGQRFLYRATASVTADAAGKVVLPVRPMIRSAALDGAVVELATPRIEGFVTLAEEAFKVVVPSLVNGLSFTIEETD